MRARVGLLGIIFVISSCSFALLAAQGITDPSEVNALKAVRRKLHDPMKYLNWTKTDPCTSKWTGVFCNGSTNDSYLHVTELRLLNLNLTGTLAPELGQLSYLSILNFLWNNLTGNIPKEIGNITSLTLLLLSGNQLSGSLPDELGNLHNLKILQIDENNLSGTFPKSFANLISLKHFHMNNNSISGQIPPEYYKLPQLLHLIVDNNNLSGYLPQEFYMMPNLKILQLDNSNFEGTGIPDSYSNMSHLVKLSLRNCNLRGTIPDLSSIPQLSYIDLSGNNLYGSIPTNKLSDNITTIILDNNSLTGPIPSNFSFFPSLQKLSLKNNQLSGDIPSNFWQNISFSAAAKLTLDFQNNYLTNISGSLNPPTNVSIWFQGNPVCQRMNALNIVHFCGLPSGEDEAPGTANSNNSNATCVTSSCFNYYQQVPGYPDPCACVAPIGVGIRLRSPSISDFSPFELQYRMYITSSLGLYPYQLQVDSYGWEKGPKLRLSLKIFPQSGGLNILNFSEVQRITKMYAQFAIASNDTYGPYELLGFAFEGPYEDFSPNSQKTGGMSKGVVAAIVLGAIACFFATSAVVIVLFYRRRTGHNPEVSKEQPLSKIPIKTESVKGFTFEELEAATKGFSVASQVGQGGYGKVYKGILANGTVVAIKRAREDSLQGQREFFTEIEMLSRLHHRNLVSLLGYCDEGGEQMLVYEFMPNGSVHDLLSDFRNPASFTMRLSIALGSAKGILYLHTEADPPIIHRDVKANNILLDSKYTAKVSDFGLSKLAPVPYEGAETHVSTGVKGTPGYLDPEYFFTHKLTEKSDVYSLGIVFLELLTAMQPISHGRNIVREVNAACQSGMMFSVIDRRMGPYSSECIKKFMALALRCCEEETKARPTMLEAVRELENICSMLPQSDAIPSDSDASNSGTPSSAANTTRKAPESTVFSGSDLVSGVIPTITPR